MSKWGVSAERVGKETFQLLQADSEPFSPALNEHAPHAGPELAEAEGKRHSRHHETDRMW